VAGAHAPAGRARPSAANAAGRSDELAAYLRMIAGAAADGRLLELRHPVARGMRQHFISARRLDVAAALIERLAPRLDVYIGVLLRTRHAGSRDACAPSHLLFVEIDHADALARLDRFAHKPSMTLASGSPGHVHCYWQLTQPIDIERLEQANRRLAHHFDGDRASIDASRILRPASSRNHKHRPPAAVRLLDYEPARRYELAPLTRALPEPPAQPSPPPARTAARGNLDEQLLSIPAPEYVRALTGLEANRAGKISCPFHDLSVGEATAGAVMPARSHADASSRDRVSVDPLLLVPPPVYFERLTGVRVGRSGKLRCLFHDDRHPSLHVYQEAGRGWYCFGCGRGGSVYDLAALLWLTGQCRDGKLRGREFLRVRQHLAEIFLGEREDCPWPDAMW
jgi:RepB DNA-primase from phage plasmid/CHC2 zinc finger